MLNTQLSLFEYLDETEYETPLAKDAAPEVMRVVSHLRECERTLSIFAVDCSLSEGERELLRRAGKTLLWRLQTLFGGDRLA
jgi:hypothetical protein